jgi:hypothetical protein
LQQPGGDESLRHPEQPTPRLKLGLDRHPRVPALLAGIHGEGGDGSHVEVGLDQDAAGLGLRDGRAERAGAAQDAHLEADDRACADAALLNLKRPERRSGDDARVAVAVVRDNGVHLRGGGRDDGGSGYLVSRHRCL